MATFTSSAGIEIGYDDSDPDGVDRPVIVFSHGLLMDREMFAAQVAELAADWRCIAWDERGHGETPAPEPFTYWHSARDLLDLLDHAGVERAVLAGMSQGGFVPLRAALLAPARVRALVLLDTQAGLELEGAAEGYQAMVDDWAANGPRREVASGAAYVIIGPGEHDSWVDRWMARPQEWVVEPFRTLVGRDDITGRLPEIDIPALVVHGSEDIAIPMERAEALAAGLPKAGDVVRVEGGTHAANMTHPAEVNAAIRAFLADLPD